MSFRTGTKNSVLETKRSRTPLPFNKGNISLNLRWIKRIPSFKFKIIKKSMKGASAENH